MSDVPFMTDATPPANPAPTPPPRIPFYVSISSQLKQLALSLCREHAELRSIGIVLDYNGALNDAKIHNTIWVAASESGKIGKLEEAFGTAYQTLRLLDLTMQAASALIQKREADAVTLSRELVAKSKKLEELERSYAELQERVAKRVAEVRELKAAGDLSPPAAGPPDQGANPEGQLGRGSGW